MSDYPHESLSDIHAFSKGCAMSKYDDGEFYACVDLPRLAKWWRKYLEEKAEARERAMASERSMREREAVDRIASIPDLADSVRMVAHNSKEQAAANAERVRLARLKERVELMTDTQLRQWWAKENHEGRAVIESEAWNRGLKPRTEVVEKTMTVEHVRNTDEVSNANELVAPMDTPSDTPTAKENAA